MPTSLHSSGGRPLASPISAALPHAPVSATIARRLVHHSLARALTAEQLSTVELLATELVTNALRHAGTSCDLALSWPRPGSLRVEVTDRGEGTPVVQGADGPDTGGHGLMLVDALAADWGVGPVTSAGKTVWFEVLV